MSTKPQRPRILRRLTLMILALAGALTAGLVMQPAAATATTTAGKTTVVDVTLQISANVLDNLCNGDVVSLHGTLNIRTATTTQANGSVRVVSTSRFTGTGARLNSTPMSYRGDDTQNTAEYTAPPPYPSSFSVLQWTKLVPSGNAPTMWLVFVLREVVTPYGTAPILERTYLTCSQPTSHDCHKES